MASTLSLTFADLLRYHRVTAGLTQEELAERAHLSVDAISTLERGIRRRPRKDTIALLADALALSSDDRAALLAAARRPPADPLAATPHEDTARNGRLPATSGDLPRGVVTFLFADIERSAQLLQQLGDRYADLLAESQELLHTVYTIHHGRELGTQGDRFFAVFAHPDDAVSAAVEAQQALARHPWPEGVDMRLRMGIHTGDALVTAGRYVGLEVARAAQLAAAGHGGQILLSRAAAEEVTKRGQEYPPGAALRHLGSHRLRDLATREPLYQLMLPSLPDRFPPLRTLDVWPMARARLVAGALLTLTLLALAGLVLPFMIPTFPRALGLVAGLADLLLVVGLALAPTQQARLRRQWRAMRQPVVALTSGLLSLVVVLTTLFASMPRQVIASHPPQGYDFSYFYHAPTHRGGTVTIEFGGALQGFMPYGSTGTAQIFTGLWQSCLTQLPDTALGLNAYKPDQCTEVPTVGNRGEDPEGKWTIFHIDPRAVWSDGAPITAADYLFADQLAQDPAIGGGGPPFQQHILTAPDPSDPRTVRIDWTAPSGFGDYLAMLIRLQPLPLHVYATGKFAGVYDPKTGAYNSALAKQLVASPGYLTEIPPVDDGPFTVQGFVPNSRAVLVRNPHFFSNYFHQPALDGVTLVTLNPQGSQPQGLAKSKIDSTLIADYRRGGVDLVDGLDSLDLSRVSGIPKAEVVTSPVPIWLELGFNQRAEAPSAQGNGGVPVFRDKNVRKAFVEAFDRCAAVRTQLGAVNCSDLNLFTDEATTLPAPDYDPSFTLPGYNPTDAARLITQAGYPVVDGIRRARDGVTPLRLTIGTSFAGAQAPLLARQLQQDYMRNLKVAVTLDLSGHLLGSGQATKGTFDIALWAETGSPDPVFNGWDTLLDFTDAADIPSAQNLGGQNSLGIIDPTVIQQVKLGSRTPDAAQSATVYRELQRYWAQQFYVEPVFILANVMLVKPTLCNFKPFPQFTGNLWSMADWYVASTCP